MTQKNLKNREVQGRRSGIVGLALNFCLFAIKLFVGLFTGSIAVIADAANNLFDAANSVVTLVGFKLAGKPADKEHPFGHGRTEDIAGLIIAISIILLGIEFIRNSIANIIEPPSLQVGILPLALLFAAFGVKLWLYIYNRRLARKIGSDTILAVAKDSRNDCIITLATMVSLIANRHFGLYIDGFVGILISIILLHTGFMAARTILGNVMGRPVDKKTADSIFAIVTAQEDIIGAHDLMVHNYGPARNVATIHAEMPMNMTIAQAHTAIDAAEAAVMEQLGIAITIHLDPVDVANEDLNRIKAITRDFLADAAPKADAHDFRFAEYFAEYDKERSLIFELALPHGTQRAASGALVQGIKRRINEIYPDCAIKVNIEFGYVEED